MLEALNNFVAWNYCIYSIDFIWINNFEVTFPLAILFPSMLVSKGSGKSMNKKFQIFQYGKKERNCGKISLFSEVWRITNSLHKRLLLNVNILFISVIFGENILRLSFLDQIINSKELNNAFKQCRKRRSVDQHFQSIPAI